MLLHKTIFHHVIKLAANIHQAARDVITGKPEAGKRSSHWPTVRKEHLRLEPTCRWCKAGDHLEVHHEKPFHDDPSLELDQKNLITLCEGGGRECHVKIGHDGNFKLFNPDVAGDCTNHPQPNPGHAKPNVPGE